MKNTTARLRPPSRWDYFVFSLQYLVLTSLVYAALIAGPYSAVKSHWGDFFIWLCVLFISGGLLYTLLVGYFKVRNKPAVYARRLTLLTIFPPVVGPIVVLQRSLE